MKIFFKIGCVTLLVSMCYSKIKPNKSPHILVILADDLGFNDVSWHNSKVHTPSLQRLADKGVILEQHYSQPKGAASRAALMTGLYPYKLGRQHGNLSPMMPTGLSTELTILPELLKRAGYKTHSVGKWHLGYCHWDYTPTRRGFDSFFGLYSQGWDHYSRITRDTSNTFKGYDLRENETVSTKGKGEYSTNLFSSEAVRVVDSHNDDQPLFLYLAYQSVQKPAQVPDKYARIHQPEGQLSQESIRLGMLSALDEGIKNITRALREKNMLKDTIIVLLSDNGGYAKGSNLPLRGRRSSVYEGGTRTVALFNYPRMKSTLKGRVSQGMIHLVDWVPTLLSLAGAAKNGTNNLDGMDQSLHLTAGWPSPRNELVYNIDDVDVITAAIRVGRWKLIWGYPEPSAPRKHSKQHRNIRTLFQATKAGLLYLYDLRSDPNETVNLATSHKKKTNLLKSRIKQLMRGRDVVPADTPRPMYRSLPKLYGGVVSPGWCSPK